MGCGPSKGPEPSVGNLPIAPPASTPRGQIGSPAGAVEHAPSPPAGAAPPAPSPAPSAPTPEPVPAAPQGAVGVRDAHAEAFGLLLCGSGESGKTTFVRQLKLRFLGGIDEQDRRDFIATIRGNMLETMQTLMLWVEQIGGTLSPDVENDAEIVASKTAFACDFTPELVDALEHLWADPVVQDAFAHKDQTVIPDHMDYFFNRLQTVMADDYVPTDEDVLRARIRSIGIDQVTFNLEGALIRIYDVGGQRNERGKWEQVMREVSGVIFCVSFADFDKPMFESLPEIEPRIHDALSVFGEISHRQEFAAAPVFLICNKFDSFKDKVRNTDCFTRVFPDYTGNPHNETECSEYLAQLFVAKANPPSETRPIIILRQDALNGDIVVENANQICRYIRVNYFEE